MKKKAFIALILGLVLTFVPGNLRLFYLKYLTNNNAAIHFGYYSTYLTQVLRVFGIITIICSIFFLIFSKQVSKRCSMKTMSISLGLSVAAGIGGISAIIFLINYKYDPLLYAVVTMLGYVVFSLLFAWYVKTRRTFRSKAGIVIEVVISLLYTLPTAATVLYAYAVYNVF